MPHFRDGMETTRKMQVPKVRDGRGSSKLSITIIWAKTVALNLWGMEPLCKL